MDQKFTVELLLEFARLRQLKCHTHETIQNHPLSVMERYSSTKFVVFDLYGTGTKTYMVFFDAYTLKASTSVTYCGIYKPVRFCRHEMQMIRRDWFDKLSFRKRVKTGDPYIDGKVTIFTRSSETDRSIVNRDTVKKYLEINKRIMPLKLSTVKNSESVVSELHEKDLVALTTNTWITEPGDLDFFITHGKELFAKL